MLKRLLALFRRKPPEHPVADGLFEVFNRRLARERAIQAELRRALNVQELNRD